jgi:hypothetical protein
VYLLGNHVRELLTCYFRGTYTYIYIYISRIYVNFSGLFPSSGIPKKKTRRFKLDLFPSSDEGGGEDTYSVGPLRGS